MTEPTDKPLLDQSPAGEQQLEEYLKGDSSVSRQYRQLHSAPVPAELDRLVLRQAEDAVKSRSTQRPAWMRWTAPLAVAASAVLVLSIVVETGLRDETALTSAPAPAIQAERRAHAESAAVERATPEAPASAAEAEASGVLEEKLAQDAIVMRDAIPSAQNVEPVAPPSVRLDVPPASAVVHSTAPAPEAPRAIAQSAPLPPAPVETPTYTVTSGQSIANAAAAAKRELEAASIEQVERTEISAFAAVRQEARSTAQRAKSEEQHQYSDPEAWLKDIRQLRKENKQEEADREWHRFRAAFPAYEVAETDTAREAKK